MKMSQKIVKQCEYDPADNVDPHPRLFSDLDEDRVSDGLFKLWQKGMVDAEWDEEEEATKWWLTHFGEELCEKGLTRAYVVATDREQDISVGPTDLVEVKR